MKERLDRAMPSAAMAIAILALGIALGGGAYAASVKLKKNSVKTKTIKNNAVTTPKIADNAVTTPKIADKAVTGGKLADGSVSSSKLGGCPGGTILYAGGCYETTPHAANNLYVASEDCGARGGRVPLAGELLAVRTQPGIDLGTTGSTDNWAAEIVHNDASAVSDGGAISVNLPGNVTNRPYRCVLPRS